MMVPSQRTSIIVKKQNDKKEIRWKENYECEMQNPIEMLEWKQQQNKSFEEELMVISHTLLDLICFWLFNEHALLSKQVLKMFLTLE